MGGGEELASTNERETMFNELDKMIMTHADWVFERLASAENETDRAYYQGQIDGMAQVRRQMAHLEKVSA